MLQNRMLKTLIVEDSTLFRQTFKEALRRKFPSMLLEEAVDGNEALKKIETCVPDLVFVDIRLPGASGLELTKKIKADHPEMLVIILTHHDLPEYRAAANNVGADLFIPKESLDLSELAVWLGPLAPHRRKGNTFHETET